jgi:hypothetical protein
MPLFARRDIDARSVHRVLTEVRIEKATMRATHLSLECLCFAACYGLLAGDWSGHEILAGLIACAGAAGFESVLRRSYRPWLRLSLSPAECARAIRSLATDSVVVAQVLMRSIWHAPAGAVGSQRRLSMDGSLEGTAQADPAAAGRQAALTLTKSIAPNEFVVDVDGGDFIVHRLADTQ